MGIFFTSTTGSAALSLPQACPFWFAMPIVKYQSFITTREACISEWTLLRRSLSFLLLHQKLIKGLLYLVAYILGKFFVWVDVDDILFGALVGIQLKVTENAPSLKCIPICRL